MLNVRGKRWMPHCYGSHFRIKLGLHEEKNLGYAKTELNLGECCLRQGRKMHPLLTLTGIKLALVTHAG